MGKELTQTETIEATMGSPPEVYGGVSQSLAVSLARAEIDQQIATSRALPRSITRAVANITTLATLDEETAAECIYALPRGGKTIRGPSIRFAEIMATQWGNCRIGARVVHVDKIEGYVEAEGVFHDLETNVAQTARVRRQIQAKRGKGIDADMIQLAGAAASSIARRNAILAGIPKGVARKGYMAVEDVIRGDVKTLGERRDLALKAFQQLGVSPDRVFYVLGVTGADDITLDHLATLTGTRSAIKSGELTVEEAFPAPRPDGTASGEKKSLADKLDRLASGADPQTGEIRNQDQQNTDAADPGAASDNRQGASGSAAGNGAASHSHGEAAPQKQKSEPKQDKAAVAKVESKPAQGTMTATTTAAQDDKRALYFADLKKEGERRAALGGEALNEFLEGLEGDDMALINQFVAGWLKLAREADKAKA